MDSCSSGGSMSSGGDDEYDSRAETSISAFYNLNHHHYNNNTNPFAHVGQLPSPPLPLQPPHHHQSMVDPLSSFFDPLSSSSSPTLTANLNSVPNLDMVWNRNLRSHHTTCTDHGRFIAASSSPTQQFFTNRTQTSQSVQILQVQDTAPKRSSAPAAGQNDHQPNSSAAAATSTNTVRNPKKRSRASRRAPTTVLTTDTTNFRAMVQEFTGIPAPPFTSLSFSRSRIDLFGNAATAAASLGSVASHLELSQPSLLLRPFSHKIQPPFLSSSSLINSMASTTTTSINAGPNIPSTTSSSDSGLMKYPTNLIDVNEQNNPILNFQSLLQPSSKYRLSNSSIPSSSDHGTTKPQQQFTSLNIPSNDSHLKMGVVEEFGFSQTQVSASLTTTAIQNTVRSDHNSSSSKNNNNGNWADGIVAPSNEVDHILRTINASNNSNYSSKAQKIAANNGKVSCIASSSDLHNREKGIVTNMNVAHTRIEGMVGSWISSSD